MVVVLIRKYVVVSYIYRSGVLVVDVVSMVVNDR